MSLPHTRRYRDRAEQLRLVEEFGRSGLTKVAFCEQQHISPSTLLRWLVKSREEGTKPALPTLFKEVRLPGSLLPLGGNTPWAVEVVRRDGVTVRLREMPEIEALACLLRARGC